VRHVTQTIAMLLFFSLDFVDSSRKQQSLVIEQPLKTSSCARHFVESVYSLIPSLLADDTQVNQIEQMLIKVEDQVVDKGLKVFVDKFDDEISCHVSMLRRLN
jgi:signal-transduction protein with cAMP-binding, CBS, and nucleotidyltransferase domain